MEHCQLFSTDILTLLMRVKLSNGNHYKCFNIQSKAKGEAFYWKLMLCEIYNEIAHRSTHRRQAASTG